MKRRGNTLCLFILQNQKQNSCIFKDPEQVWFTLYYLDFIFPLKLIFIHFRFYFKLI